MSIENGFKEGFDGVVGVGIEQAVGALDAGAIGKVVVVGFVRNQAAAGAAEAVFLKIGVGPFQDPVIFVDGDVNAFTGFDGIHPVLVTGVIDIGLTENNVGKNVGIIFIQGVSDVVLLQEITQTIGHQR